MQVMAAVYKECVALCQRESVAGASQCSLPFYTATCKACFTTSRQFVKDMLVISAHAADIGGYLFSRENAALWKDAGGVTGHGHLNRPSQGPLNYYRP